MATPRQNFPAVVAGGRIYALGGERGGRELDACEARPLAPWVLWKFGNLVTVIRLITLLCDYGFAKVFDNVFFLAVAVDRYAGV